MVSIPLDQEGKTPKRTTVHGAVERAELLTARNLTKHIRKLMELAVGVLVQEEDAEGNPRIYRTPPDRRALEFLVDHGMGKAPQRFELKADDSALQYIAWRPTDEAPAQAQPADADRPSE